MYTMVGFLGGKGGSDHKCIFGDEQKFPSDGGKKKKKNNKTKMKKNQSL